MRRLLAQLPETPALVLGRCLDVLAWNRPAVALYTDFAAIPVQGGLPRAVRTVVSSVP